MENSRGPGAQQAPKSWKPKRSSPLLAAPPACLLPCPTSEEGLQGPPSPPVTLQVPKGLLPQLASQTPAAASECTILCPESICGESRREAKQE